MGFSPKKRAAFFDKILLKTPSTNTFDLSFDNKLSFNMGKLIPILTQEVVPGDKFKIDVDHLIKLAPLVTPVFHKVKVQTHFFFVPNRLLWDNFESYQAYDTLNTIPPHPVINLRDGNNWVNEVTSLADYIGIPTGDFSVSQPQELREINALPFAAYFKIYDDYFRDQNLVSEKWDPLTDGDNTGGKMFTDLVSLQSLVFKADTTLNRAWEKDYFTSCLPFAQKGQEVVLPLGTTAPIVFTNTGFTDLQVAGGGVVDSGQLNAGATGPIVNIQDDTAQNLVVDNSDQLSVDLSNATSASINSLRVSIRLQEFFERNARLGTRYIEQMLGKFGVRISDERAHRSEYFGSITSPVLFSEVLQTSETASTPLGQQGGHGQSIKGDFAGSKYCEEHGWIIGIMSVLPDTEYSQGLHRKFVKRDILDYYDPMFAQLGEQEVKNFEIYADSSNGQDTFGYQSRYAELKYNASETHGSFRTTEADWTMSRQFSAPPVLNGDFVTADPTHRIYADTDPTTQKVYAWVHLGIQAERKIPYFSTPTINSSI